MLDRIFTPSLHGSASKGQQIIHQLSLTQGFKWSQPWARWVPTWLYSLLSSTSSQMLSPNLPRWKVVKQRLCRTFGALSQSCVKNERMRWKIYTCYVHYQASWQCVLEEFHLLIPPRLPLHHLLLHSCLRHNASQCFHRFSYYHPSQSNPSKRPWRLLYHSSRLLQKKSLSYYRLSLLF